VLVLDDFLFPQVSQHMSDQGLTPSEQLFNRDEMDSIMGEVKSCFLTV